VSEDLESLAAEAFCYLTTTGRVTGQPHTIEIWFAAGGKPRTLYLLSGGRDSSDWVKNIRRDPRVTLKLGDERFSGRARILDKGEEDARARRLLAAKYEGWSDGRALSGWARTSLPVAIELEV